MKVAENLSTSAGRWRPATALGNVDAILQNEWRLAVIEYFKDELRAEMLGRIVMFGSDPIFQRLARELSKELFIDPVAGAGLLWPTSNEIYKAAVTAHE